MPLEEQKKSRLYALKPLTDRLPAVSRPEGHVQFRTKMFWVLAILVLYFAMTNVFIYGLDRTNVIDFFSSLRAILAGAQGSLMHLGIGPIVTASIIMQLFAGAKIINLNLQDDEDKSVYQGTQKFLVIVMIFVEAIPQVFGFLTPAGGFVSALNGSILFSLISSGHGDMLAKLLIVLQLFGGSYLVFLMDEVVSKWGIGSGISLFIAGGVAQQIFTGTFNWEPSQAGGAVPAGTIPKTVYYLQHYSGSQLAGGGIEQIMVQPPNPLIALIGTVAIFLIVAYVESHRAAPRPRHGSGRSRPLSNPADVRVEHPCDPGGGGPGEREHVLPPVLAAPGVAARRPRLVDRSVSRSDGHPGDGWPDPTHDADRRPRVLFLERERRPGLAFAALQSESVRRLPARASVLASLPAYPRLPRGLHRRLGHVREVLDYDDEHGAGGRCPADRVQRDADPRIPAGSPDP